MLKAIKIRLGAPNYPGDTMILTGTVAAKHDDGRVEIAVRGANAIGDHVTGTVVVAAADGSDVMSVLPGAAAIVGIGATEFSKDSGRSELRLACEAVRRRHRRRRARSRPTSTAW